MKYNVDSKMNKFIIIRQFMNWNGLINFKKISWRIGTQINDPITAKALIGRSSVPICNPNSSMIPGPEIVDMPLLVKPSPNISNKSVSLFVEKMPIILMIVSTMTKASIVLPNPSLSPKQPHKKVPKIAVMVLATKQYPKKWSSFIVGMKINLKLLSRKAM